MLVKNGTVAFSCICAGIALAAGAHAQFVPPAGYSADRTRPGVAVPTDPDAPPLTRIPDATLAGLIRVDPSYARGGMTGHAKLVGAFAIAQSPRTRLIAAWSPGFLPVTLSFSDGRCFSLAADYVGGTLSNGRLSRIECERQRKWEEPAVPSPPSGARLRFVGSAWGYGAWADDRTGTAIITPPGTKTFQPLFTVRMAASAIMAMNGPDWPGGNVTLVGTIDGRLTVLTLEVGY